MPSERDDRAAAIGPVAAAIEQTGVVETVQNRDEVRGIDTEQLHERLLSRRSTFTKVLEGMQLARTQPQRLDCLLDRPAHPRRELRAARLTRRIRAASDRATLMGGV